MTLFDLLFKFLHGNAFVSHNARRSRIYFERNRYLLIRSRYALSFRQDTRN